MHYLALALVLMPLSAASAQTADAPHRPQVAKPCVPGPTIAKGTLVAPGRSQKLGEMPPAQHIRTVWRNMGGCTMPVVVRDGIGNHAPR